MRWWVESEEWKTMHDGAAADICENCERSSIISFLHMWSLFFHLVPATLYPCFIPIASCICPGSIVYDCPSFNIYFLPSTTRVSTPFITCTFQSQYHDNVCRFYQSRKSLRYSLGELLRVPFAQNLSAVLSIVNSIFFPGYFSLVLLWRLYVHTSIIIEIVWLRKLVLYTLFDMVRPSGMFPELSSQSDIRLI